MRNNSTVRVYLVKLGDSIIFSEGKLSDKLPFSRREKIQQYIKAEDKSRCYYSWKLLELALKDSFSIDLNNEQIIVDDFGKPHFVVRDDVHFNLSHSGEFVCCIVDKYPVGIDVEPVSPIDLSIASEYFSASETSDLFNLPECERLDYFYKLWTLKESYIKAEGKGLSIPLDSFSFKVNGEAIIFVGENSSYWDFALRDINVGGRKYYLAFCVRKRRIPLSVIEVPYASL